MHVIDLDSHEKKPMDLAGYVACRFDHAPQPGDYQYESDGDPPTDEQVAEWNVESLREAFGRLIDVLATKGALVAQDVAIIVHTMDRLELRP